MNSRVTIVYFATMAYVHGMPGKINAPAADAPAYFQNKLNQIQGAIDDTVRAGMDLETMEARLQDIVNLSSYFYLTESATEYAVDKDAYKNSWDSGAASADSDSGAASAASSSSSSAAAAKKPCKTNLQCEIQYERAKVTGCESEYDMGYDQWIYHCGNI